MDSLRYWVEVCHVDGFRFDLATTLARGPNGFDRNAPFLTAVRQDPVLATVKLIAEPWDLGMGGYQVGAFPVAMVGMERPLSQRDAALLERRRQPDRRGLAPHDRLLRPVPSRRPRDRAPASITSPSMTVLRWPTCSATTTSTTRRTARTIATAPTTTTATIAAHEGPTDDAAITALRRQLRKNQLACLLLAQGTPLMLAGDEVGNSQSGNNNAYCQDNETGWVELGQSRQAGRRPHRFRRPADRAAPALRPASRPALARRAARGWLLWRAVADAGGRGDDRKPTGIFRKAASSPMCSRRWNKGRRRSLSC